MKTKTTITPNLRIRQSKARLCSSSAPLFWYRSVPSKNFNVGSERYYAGKRIFYPEQWIAVNKNGVSIFERDYYWDWDSSVAYSDDILLHQFTHAEYLTCVNSQDQIEKEVNEITPKTLHKKFDIPKELWIEAKEHTVKHRMKIEDANAPKTNILFNFEFRNSIRTKLLASNDFKVTQIRVEKTYLNLPHDIEKLENQTKFNMFSLQLTPNEYYEFSFAIHVARRDKDANDTSNEVNSRFEFFVPPKEQVEMNLVLQSVPEEAPENHAYLYDKWKNEKLANKYISPAWHLLNVFMKAEKGKPVKDIEFLHLELDKDMKTNTDYQPYTLIYK